MMTSAIDPTRQLETAASLIACALDEQRDAWQGGHTRRSFLAGVGMVGVAALASQLVTAKAAYAATPETNTLVHIFLRGAADGLRMLVPATSALGVDYLRSVRPGLVPGDSNLLPLGGGWALNNALAPLLPFWKSGELAFVPAVSNRGLTRSHFQAQQFLDTGGQQSARSGWLDRLLAQLGPGTTFRAIGDGAQAPGAIVGTQRKLVIDAMSAFALPSINGAESRTADAIAGLYRGASGSLPVAVNETLTALKKAAPIRAGKPANGARYPAGSALSSTLADIAKVLRAEAGLQIAAVEVGGWDTHTSEATMLDPQFAALATTLAAFMQDLGPSRRSRVTVVVSTEFGRRVAQNGSGGTDHGHGSGMFILGGGLRSAQVAGKWEKLSAAALDQGDVAGLNDPFQVLAEIARARLGGTNTSALFPGLDYRPLNLMRSVTG